MRKIIATAFVSLDGVMQGPGGAQEDTSGGFDLGGWTTNYRSEKSGAAVLDMVGTLAKPYDLLLGRKTYDNFASFWPNIPADNPIGPVFTKANKYVLTGSSAKLEWANSHQLRNLDESKKVKAEEGSDIVLWGSSTLYPQLLDANLIDRLQLLSIPIVLGKGKRIFGNTSHQVPLKLMKCEATSTGVIMGREVSEPKRLQCAPICGNHDNRVQFCKVVNIAVSSWLSSGLIRPRKGASRPKRDNDSCRCSGP